ncbi:Squalene/phytoene synthase-domain-containing protein [Jimgerdemannia flammicorona]|uniref:Squalene/phytoene synthase-domain-containing protein n=1 Tax=Jimgerdemannia flammicorona TaxID=994334 RepID=A0A433QA73_9FUNG|nr:Squalene/phytoene synthase-domain-containing protein [Jimgerdemannia flammicorona]
MAHLEFTPNHHLGLTLAEEESAEGVEKVEKGGEGSKVSEEMKGGVHGVGWVSRAGCDDALLQRGTPSRHTRLILQMSLLSLTSVIPKEKLDSALGFCRELVRTSTLGNTKHETQDYENYLCVPFFPRPIQPAQYALRAFNIEIASVRESVSNQTIGKMRMQFWRDTIDQVFAVRVTGCIAKKPPQQPIALALSHALETTTLSPLWFKRIIAERESILDDPQYMTIVDVERYAENTASALLYLQLESMGVREVSADHAASHLGKAIGIATLLRALPFHATKRRLVLPAEVTAKVWFWFLVFEGGVVEEVFRTGGAPGLADAVFEVATTAHDHILTARSLAERAPAGGIPVMLAAVPCNDYLKRLESHNFNVFEPQIQVRDWRLPLRLWNSYRKRTF